jgi:pimeloyl-ACP methyl ester carboxylesterase
MLIKTNKTRWTVLLLLMGQMAFGRGIDTTMTLRIGGIGQVLQVKGQGGREAPILLYLHGAGPNAYSLIANADKLTSKLQEHFTVVLWDQRDYGQTFMRNKSPEPATVQLMVNDTKAIVDYLLQTFQQQKLYIAGHSMGSIMGMYIAQQYPERLYALIEMCPGVHGIESQRLGVLTLKKHFKKMNNERAVQELSKIKLPARDFESLFTRFVWQSAYDGNPINDTLRETLKPMLSDWMKTPAAQLSNEVFEMDFFKLFPAVRCPIYFFVGRKDLMTNANITEKYYKKLKAPRKQLFWFEQSGHALPDTEADKMQGVIIGTILPETFGR